MKKTDKDKMILKTVEQAADHGYRIMGVVLKYATCWWAWKPKVAHFGFFASEERALQSCNKHLERTG